MLYLAERGKVWAEVKTVLVGEAQEQQVAAVADGAEWIQHLLDAHRADAVRILDFYHAAEYVSEIAALSARRLAPWQWKC